MGRMKSEVKMISLIKKEDSESAKAVTNLDTEAQLKSHQSMDLFFPKIIKSLFKEINEMNLLKSETNEGRNTQVLTKNENTFCQLHGNVPFLSVSYLFCLP